MRVRAPRDERGGEVGRCHAHDDDDEDGQGSSVRRVVGNVGWEALARRPVAGECVVFTETKTVLAWTVVAGKPRVDGLPVAFASLILEGNVPVQPAATPEALSHCALAVVGGAERLTLFVRAAVRLERVDFVVPGAHSFEVVAVPTRMPGVIRADERVPEREGVTNVHLEPHRDEGVRNFARGDRRALSGDPLANRRRAGGAVAAAVKTAAAVIVLEGVVVLPSAIVLHYWVVVVVVVLYRLARTELAVRGNLTPIRRGNSVALLII